MANFGASGRSCFVLLSKPETAVTGESKPGMLEESSCKVPGPGFATSGFGILDGETTVERQAGPPCPEVTEETKESK